MAEQFKYLFAPIKIGPVTVRNRIFTSAHLAHFSKDNTYVEYQRTRAKGGVGLITAGMMSVMPNSKAYLNITEVYDQRAVPMLK